MSFNDLTAKLTADPGQVDSSGAGNFHNTLSLDVFDSLEDAAVEYFLPLSWTERADEIDALLWHGYYGFAQTAGEIETDGQWVELLSWAMRNFSPLVRKLDEGEISSLDHALLVNLFLPERSRDANRWFMDSSIPDDDIMEWREAHRGCELIVVIRSGGLCPPAVH